MSNSSRLTYAALLVSLAPVAARAQKDMASCQPIFDAMTKQATTPTHMYTTTTAAYTKGAPRNGEMITTSDARYLLAAGQWRRVPLDAKEILAQAEENRRNAKAYTCRRTGDEAVGGVAATVYTAHSATDDDTSDARIWIAKGSGLIVRQETDLDVGGAMGKSHTSTRYEYANVRAPAGAR